MNKISHNRHALFAGISGFALMVSANAAKADTVEPAPVTAASSSAAPDAAADSEIIVTGTQIRGVAAVGSAVIALGRDDFEKLGVSSTSDILRTVPSVLNLGTDSSHYVANQKANANVTFATGINLRGVGTADTLILVNGRRIAPAGIGAFFTDLNVIPEAAISRMEVQADGASAIYGADAVAGVVNVHLRQPFDGGETSVRYGGGHGQDQYMISQVFGKTWGTGGIFVALEYRNQSALKGSSFPDRYTDNFKPFGGPDLRATSASPGSIVVGSTFYALPANPSGGPILASQLVAGAANRQGGYEGGIDAIPAQHRGTGLVTFNQELGAGIKLFAEGFYSSERFKHYRNALADGISSVSVPVTNPFYISGIPGIAVGANETVNYSLLNDIGPVYNFGGEDASMATIGLKFSPGGDWQITPSVSYSTDFTSRATRGVVNNCAFNGAIGGFTTFGQACVGTPAIKDSNPLTAFNPFAPGKTSAATLARIAGGNIDTTLFHRFDANVRADGSLLTIPGGKVRLAVGAEYTHDSLSHHQARNDGNNTPDNTTLKTLDGVASRSGESVYGELYVPIFGEDNAVAGIQSLVLSLAGRYEHFSDFGSSTNPKIGLNWSPVRDLTIHASYGTSFRAPTLSDSSPTVVGTSQFNVQSLVNGLYPTIGAIGSNVSALVLVGGNPNLKPERARTYSFGAELKPGAIPGLSLSVNYFNLDLKDTISTAGANLTNSAVTPFVTLNPSAAAIAPYCTSPFFTTGVCGANVVAIINGAAQNLGRNQTDGIEFSGSYSFDTKAGTFNIGAVGSYVIHFKQSALPGAALLEQVNKVNFPLKFIGRASLGWALGGFNATAFVNYQNSYANETITPFERVKSNTTVDLTMNYDTGSEADIGIAKNLQFSVHITNLFDKAPPYARYQGSAFTSSFAFDPQSASGLGRTMSLQVTKKY